MGVLYNLIIQQRNYATSSHRRAYRRQLTGQHITELINSEPEFQGLPHKLLTSVEKQVHKAFSDYFKYLRKKAQGIHTPKKGRPKTKDPHRTRTLIVPEPEVGHLTLRNLEHRQLNLYETLNVNLENAGIKPKPKAIVSIKGLPNIWFKPDHRLPKNTQPQEIRITLSPKRLLLSLVYEIEKHWPEPTRDSVGGDPGVVKSLTTSDSEGEIVYHPGHDTTAHRKVIRRIKRKLQRQRDQALLDGRARWTTHRNRKGLPKRRFRWTGKPSKSYLKTLLRLRKVEQARSDSLKGWQHRLTTHLVKTHRTICLEDTKITNLTRSTKGTVENPGTNVAQQRGRNRSIMAQRWGSFRRMLEYKSQWAGRNLVPVASAYTSQTCSQCGYVDSENRKRQDKFQCTSCGYPASADANAAENIRLQGLEVLGRAEESPQGELREPPETPKGEITPHGSRVKPGRGRARRNTKLNSNGSNEPAQFSFEIF